jgi:hypothetical protein
MARMTHHDMQMANLKRQPLIRSHAFENGQLLSDSILGFRSFSVQYSAKDSTQGYMQVSTTPNDVEESGRHNLQEPFHEESKWNASTNAFGFGAQMNCQ